MKTEHERITDWRPEGIELPPRPKTPWFNIVVDILVWIVCIAFSMTVAGSYLMATL